jgi:hypothetical protein
MAIMWTGIYESHGSLSRLLASGFGLSLKDTRTPGGILSEGICSELGANRDEIRGLLECVAKAPTGKDRFERRRARAGTVVSV